MVAGITQKQIRAVSTTSGMSPRAAATPAAQTQPAPAPAPQDVLFTYNPQDGSVMPAGKLLVNGVREGKNHNPETALVVLNEPLEMQDGKYVFGPEDERRKGAAAFAAAAHAVSVFQGVFGEVKWSFKYPQLAVNANGGKDFNAFYGRKNGTVNFFQDTDPVLGREVHSGSSGEIVAHEVGHALLDGIRPEYFGAWRSDVNAFHEAFGDILAMHVTLMDDRVVRRVAIQTGGDLSRPNIAANIAEELGVGLNNKKGHNASGGDYLRSALNSFTWADPKTLPEKGGPDALGWEAHDFSRLWVGAHYDVLKALVKERVDGGMPAEQAIREANNELLVMLARMLKEAPRGDFTYKDMAVAFVRSDKMHNQGARAQLIRDVFTQRKILPADLPDETFEPEARSMLFQSTEETPVTQVSLRLGDDFGMWSGARVEVPIATDRAIFRTAEIQEETEDEMRRLIAAGKIRYNNPNQQMEYPKDYFNPHGEPYVGAVTWENGEMKIERLPIAV